MASASSDSINENGEAKKKTILEDKSKDDLIKIVKKQLALLQRAKAKADELNNKCIVLEEKQILQEKESSTVIDLQNQLEKLEISISDLNLEKNKLKEEKDNEIQHLERKLQTLETEKNKYFASLNENEERLQCLSMQMNTMKETCHCFQDEIMKLQKAKLEMEAEVIVLTEARDSALKSLKTKNISDSINTEFEDLKKKYSICIEQNCSLTSTIESLETEMKSLQNENSNLLSKIENMTLPQNETSDNKCVDNDLMLLIADNQTLQAEVNSLKKERESLKEKVISIAASGIKNNEDITVSDKTPDLEEIRAIKKENQELLQNLCNIESSNSKLKNTIEDLEKEKESLNKKLLRLEDEKSKGILELKSAFKEKLELKEEILKLSSSLQNFIGLETGYEHALLQGATTQGLLSESNNNQNINLQSVSPDLSNKNNKSFEKSNQHYESGLTDLESGFEFGLLGGGDITDMFENIEQKVDTESNKYSVGADDNKTENINISACSTAQNDVEVLKTKVTELNNLVQSLQKQNVELAEEIVGKESSCQEYASLVEEIVADNESLKLKIDKYEKENAETDNSVVNSSTNTAIEMIEKSFHLEKVTGLEMEMKALLSALEEKNLNLNEKYSSLEVEKLDYLQKCLSLSEELELLKIEIQKLKTDNKNLEVLKENAEQHSCILEKQNYELSEKLEIRCSELDDINFQIELLVISIKQGVRQKTAASTNKAEKPLQENISLLKTLIDDLVILSNDNAIKIKNTESDMEELLVQKQACDYELFQMRELNQFLEDEAQELRSEVEQLKLSQSSNDVYLRGKSPELYSIEEIDEKCSSADASEETDASVALSITEKPESNITDNVENNESNKTNSASDGLGIQESIDPVATVLDKETMTSDDSEYKLLIEELKVENSHLKSNLDIKSKLVDGIHCQMDLLLEKIEIANLELKNKTDDLENSRLLIEDFKKRIHELQSNVLKQEVLSSIKEGLSELKTEQNKLQADILDHNEFSSKILLTTSKNTIESINQIKEKYECLYDKKKHSETIVGCADTHLRTIITNLKLWLDTIEEIHSKEGEVVDYEKLNHCIEKINKAYSEFSFTSLSEQTESDSHCSELKETVKKLGTTANLFSSVLYQYLSSNSSILKEIDSYKTDIVPNLEITIKTLEKKLQDYSNKKECKETPELVLEQSVEKGTESSEVDIKNQLADTEIKMNKFKQIALKLKKELVESKKQCNEVSKEKEKLQLKLSELQKESEKISSEQFLSMQNYQSLQNEYDKIQDELDIQKENGKRLEGDLSTTLHEFNSFKEKFSDMEGQLLKSNQKVDSISSAKEEKEKAFVDLESKLIVLESKSQERLHKIEELENSLKLKMENINSLTLENNKLKERLDHSLKEGEKSNLLNLEMADYERSIQELNSNIQEKDEEIEELNEKLNSELEKNNTLLEEIKFTETIKATEEKRADNLKESLEKAKSELIAIKEREVELLSRVSSLQIQLENVTQQEENCKLQLSETSSKVLQLKEMLKTSSENQQRIVRSLESKISSQKQEITSAHNEIENIKEEFENYKVRVHSVLKQQKGTTTTVVSVDDDVKEKLEVLIDKLKMQVKDLSEKLKVVTIEYETLQDEHDILLKRHSKAVEDRDKKDAEWLSRLEQMNAEKSKLRAAQEEQSSQHILQNEMLVATYKKQIKIMSDEHKRAVNELQKQLESADMEIVRLQRDQQKVQGLPPTPTFQDSALPFDILSQERQEGEGSESIDELDTPIRHLSLATIPTSGFLPFEKLLQSPTDTGTPTNFVRYQDCEKMLADLNAANKQIEHLSEVLNDSESTNLRFSEQVRVLKEEVRRLERNKEREEHAENLEYLKNVFIKFATLTAGSEKAMLIPVLTTMLKLSPAEQQQLKNIAGDIDPNEAGSGWGSYLHRWSSLA